MLPELVGRVLGWLKAWPHAWWFLQVLGCTTIFLCNLAAGHWGFKWFVYMFNVINVLFVTGWCFALSYSIAVPLNKFLAAWFVAQGALSLYGFLGGAIFDGKAITAAQLLGALLVSLGSYLLIK